MLTTMKWQNYVAMIEYDPDIRMFHGRVINANSIITFYGASVNELDCEFEKSMQVYFDLCQEQGKQPDKPYSGRFNIRMTPQQHERLAAAAAASGKSLNAWVVEKLERAVD